MAIGILIIEDEAVLAKKVAKYLTRHGFEARTAGTGSEGLEALEAFRPDAVLLDFNLPGKINGLEVLTRIHALDPGVKVILVTGHGNVQLAVDAMKAGAHDYVSKPVVLSELKLLLEKAVGQARIETQLSYYKARQASKGGLDRIIGASPAIQRLRQRISKIIEAEGNLSDGAPPAVLITGETGTGKELAARALHFDGPRKDRPFIELNAATIPSHLVESELFGYERGAFTDASERKIGLVEAADGGTLFLDEIGELDISVQAKLLKLLEDRVVRRLGSVRDRTVDVRVVTATNRALKELVAEGKFREDLFYRLHVITVALPPLRERGDDVVMLAERLLALHERRYGKQGLRFTEAAMDAIRHHSWPGNVRELRNVIEPAVLLAETTEIGTALLAIPEVAQEENPPPPDGATKCGDDTDASVGKLEAVERNLISQTLAEVDGNVSKAAKLLGISRDRLRYRIEKYGLHRRLSSLHL